MAEDGRLAAVIAAIDAANAADPHRERTAGRWSSSTASG